MDDEKLLALRKELAITEANIEGFIQRLAHADREAMVNWWGGVKQLGQYINKRNELRRAIEDCIPKEG